MVWSSSYIHSNGTDQFYVKPKPITASPGFSSNAILATQNPAFSREYLFTNLVDGVDYALFQRLGGLPANTDTFIDTLKAPTTEQQTTAAAIRAAIGLATANLDAQITLLPSANSISQTIANNQLEAENGWDDGPIVIIAANVEAMRKVVEADVVLELYGGVYVQKTLERGTETELIPDKVIKQPSGTDLTNPATQRFGGAAQP